MNSSSKVFASTCAFDGSIIISSIVFSTLGLLSLLSMPLAACYALIGVGGSVILLNFASGIVLFYKRYKNKIASVYFEHGKDLSYGKKAIVNGKEMTQRQCFLEALKFNPFHAQAYFYLGASLYPDKNIVVNKKVMNKNRLYGKAAELDPDHASAYRDNPVLPPEMWSEIFNYLPKEELLKSCSWVNRKWALAVDIAIRRKLYQDELNRMFKISKQTANQILGDCCKSLAYSKIVKAQLVLGLLDIAKQTASQIPDAFKSLALLEVVKAELATDLLEEAMQTASQIPDGNKKSAAFAKIAEAQTAKGLFKEAGQTASQVSNLLNKHLVLHNIAKLKQQKDYLKKPSKWQIRYHLKLQKSELIL